MSDPFGARYAWPEMINESDLGSQNNDTRLPIEAPRTSIIPTWIRRKKQSRGEDSVGMISSQSE